MKWRFLFPSLESLRTIQEAAKETPKDPKNVSVGPPLLSSMQSVFSASPCLLPGVTVPVLRQWGGVLSGAIWVLLSCLPLSEVLVSIGCSTALSSICSSLRGACTRGLEFATVTAWRSQNSLGPLINSLLPSPWELPSCLGSSKTSLGVSGSPLWGPGAGGRWHPGSNLPFRGSRGLLLPKLGMGEIFAA